MTIRADEYEAFRGFLAYCIDRGVIFPNAALTPESHPIRHLDALALRSPATARRGLAMAVNDTLESSARLAREQVLALDAGLSAAGLPTLSATRGRFWKRIHSALRRGRIRGETEYYAVKNAAETAETDDLRDRLDALLTHYEQQLQP